MPVYMYAYSKNMVKIGPVHSEITGLQQDKWKIVTSAEHMNI